ncbi:MAG TPA: 2-oxoacid ferredoxin oxidoreductase, partial [Deltaproteobacteria bacterium]|nr:2-oxoacid ferredoxin oxidoreductase [Deltaproteobacteria bacterium]
VTFNKKNNYQWYGKRVYRIPAEHDPSDRKKALDLALEWEEKIPIGVLYRAERPSFGERHPAVPGPPLHEREAKEPVVRELLMMRTFTAR